MAMQVPVVMTTALGQKISTVAVQQPTGATGASSHPALLTSTSTVGGAANAAANAHAQQKVWKQTLLMPVTHVVRGDLLPNHQTDPINGCILAI